MTLSPEAKRRRNGIRLDDLPHMATLPAFVFCELLLLKQKIARCERMIRRHGHETRRGHPWFRKARRLDKLYCRLWRRFPAPLVFSDPIPLPDGAVTDHPRGCVITNVSLTMTTELCPLSGFRKRLPRWLKIEYPT